MLKNVKNLKNRNNNNKQVSIRKKIIYEYNNFTKIRLNYTKHFICS